MLIINEKYAIKNDGLCYAVCQSKKEKGQMVYRSRWYLNTLAQAICFLVDREIKIPSDLETMSKDIETFKNDIKTALEGQGLETDIRKK